MKEKLAEEKWQLVGHSYQIADTGDYDGHYEITNGKVSLLTKDDDEEGLQKLVDALNASEIKFYTDDKTDELNFTWSEIARLNREREAKEASIGEGEVERKIISDFNAWVMDQDVCGEDFNDVLNDYFNARRLNSPLTKSEASIGGDEIRYSEDDGYFWVKNTPYTDGEILEVIKNKTYYTPLTKAK